MNPCCGHWDFLFIFCDLFTAAISCFSPSYYAFLLASVHTEYLSVVAGMSSNALATEMGFKIVELEGNWTWRRHLHSYFIVALLWDAAMSVTQEKHKKAWELTERRHFLKYPSEFLLRDRNLFYFCFYLCSLYVSIWEKFCAAKFSMYFFLLNM